MNVLIVEHDPRVRLNLARLVRGAGYEVTPDACGPCDVLIVDPAGGELPERFRTGDDRPVVIGVGRGAGLAADDDGIDVRLAWPADAGFLVRVLHYLAAEAYQHAAPGEGGAVV